MDAITSLAAAAVLFFFRVRNAPVHASVDEPTVESSQRSSLLTDRPFLVFLFGIFLVSFVFFQHEGALPLFLVQTLNESPAFYGVLFTINTLVIVALEIPLNSATADWPHSHSLGLGAALITIGFGALAVADSAVFTRPDSTDSGSWRLSSQ